MACPITESNDNVVREDAICDWMLENQPKCHTWPSYSMLLAQLIVTLIHYPCSVALLGNKYLTFWNDEEVFLEHRRAQSISTVMVFLSGNSANATLSCGSACELYKQKQTG